jgi:general nucleoside transport system ATP-binding protein
MFRLELEGITKQYPGVIANDRVSLRLRPGEIHAVLGENGAGKSTLMKVIYGAVTPDAGELRWNGTRVRLSSPREARALGIAMVYQHFSLFESLTVAENVWLGQDRKSSLAETSRQIARLSAAYALPLDAARPVHSLGVGERQRVELLRALLGTPQLLILDEPTSVLAPAAIARLFETLRQLAHAGCSILYVSHKLDEIRALCESCTVLRAGRVTGTVDPRQESNASLSRLMIGAEPPGLARQERLAGEAALEIEAFSLAADEPFGVALQGVSLRVRRGESLGIAGVSGNGQKELLALLSGEDARPGQGRARLFGHDLAGLSALRRRQLGLHFAPAERLGRATVPSLSLALNALLTRREPVRRGGWIAWSKLRSLCQRVLQSYDVRAPSVETAAQSLSGGNLQKYVMGRELDAAPQLFIASQPTWGVDVGASAQIRRQLLALRDAGSAVLVASEDLDELFEISDALVVMANGRISPRISTRDAGVDQIGEWMSGLWPGAGPASAAGAALV